ncbi:MAG TPA: hypothetical protein VIH93_01235 [Thermoanaerobaculia bacterium]|jgi:hypothetical protein
MILYLPVWIALAAVRAGLYFLNRDRGAPAQAGPRRRRSRARPEMGTANFYLALFYLFCVSPFVVIPVTEQAGRLPSFWMAAILAPVLLAAGGYTMLVFPHWLAWRVCGPWRVPLLGRLPLFLAIRFRLADRQGAAELYAARFGRGWDRRLPATSPWTLAAAAWQAETAGDPPRADLLLSGLRRVPPKTRIPRRARAIAAEGLAWAAAGRGEWERARDRASASGGRGVGLVRRIAEAHLGESVSRGALLAAWALAPGRIAAFSSLRAALALAGRASANTATGLLAASARLAAPSVIGPHLAHLQLLARAVAGRPVSASDVLRLASAWTPELDGGKGAELVRRALELGATDLSDLPQDLERSILAELDALAEVAEGGWSGEDGEVAARLRQQRAHRAFEAVREEVEAFDRGKGRDARRRMTFPMDELERWLTLRERVERLVKVGGGDALATAWHNGLRAMACNWGVFLVEERGPEAQWAAALMHDWSRQLAERVGDEEIATLSASNLQIVRKALR